MKRNIVTRIDNKKNYMCLENKERSKEFFDTECEKDLSGEKKGEKV